ncbi:MAG: C39 family peptidase [Gordonia sp. (in: high G+C Gram-positive bacteria)]
MSQIIVPHTYHAQQTGYTCGPSTAKVVLSTFGLSVSEAQLARECGTTVDGTPDVANINAVLTRRAGRRYSARYIGTATSDRVAELRAAIRGTVVDSRRGMPVNIWAQGATRPPGYPWELIMHYVAAVGYDDTTDQVYISDSARFSGIEHWWMGVERLAVNITPKGYGALTEPTVPDVFGALSPASQQAVLAHFAQLGPS